MRIAPRTCKTWPPETRDDYRWNMRYGMKENNVCSKAVGGDYAVPTGRFEKRIARAVTGRIRPEDERHAKERS